MALHTHNWNGILDDLRDLFKVGYSASQIYNAINSSRRDYHFYLTCGYCSNEMMASIRNLYEHHLSPTSTPPVYSCPECGHSGGHHYNGVR